MAKNILELIKTWHGSPHDFDAFDFSHMGKGEGAQVYGKGGYSTESRDVAQQYKDTLGGTSLTINGEPADSFQVGREFNIDPQAAHTLHAVLKQSKGNIPEALDSLYASREAWQKSKYAGALDVIKDIDSAIETLKGSTRDIGVESTGKLYELGLDVDPQKMLDWREPLSIQPKILDLIGGDAQLIADKVNNRRSARAGRVIGDPEQFVEVDPLKLTGKEVYRGVGELYQDRVKSSIDLIRARRNELDKIVTLDDLFASDHGKPLSDVQKRAWAEWQKLNKEEEVLKKAFSDPYFAATEKLRNQGVQGIQYLGEFNRTQGEGARNYVNFNADEMKILNKYLRPETAVIAGAGAVAGLAPNDSFAGVGTPDYALPMAAQAAGQSDLSGKANPGREVGTVLAGLDMLLPLVGEAFKPATMGNAELTDEIRKRGYYGM